MTINLVFKTSIIWGIIALLAIINGIFREGILLSNLGQNMAILVSGIMLSIIVFMVTYISFPLFGKHHVHTYFLIGLQWVIMTLIFELIFGHYVMGKPWSEILQVFNIMQDDLFIIVLVVSLFSPLLVAKMRNK